MSECKPCKSHENEVQTIPYIVYENSETRHERKEKRLLIIIGVLIGLFFVSNMAWLYVFQSYDYTSEITVDGTTGGNANYIDGKGNIYNGEGYKDNKTD